MSKKMIWFLCKRHLLEGMEPTVPREILGYDVGVGMCHVCKEYCRYDEPDFGNWVSEDDAERAYEQWIGECAGSDLDTFAKCLALVAERNMDNDYCGGFWHTDDTVKAIKHALELREK